MSFFKQMLDAAVNGAAQLAAVTSAQGADLKVTGAAAGAGAIAGVLSFILAHPLGQHPAVQAAKALKVELAPNTATSTN